MRGVENVRVWSDWCHGCGWGRGEGRVGDIVLHFQSGYRGSRRTPHWLVGPLVYGVPTMT